MMDKNLPRAISNDDDHQKVALVYDGECPVCTAYCKSARIRDSDGELQLVDARLPSGIKDELTRKGLDIDQGMAVKIGDDVYYGSDAVHALSLLSSRSGIFNRLNYWAFRSPRRAAVLYPVLRNCRNFLLKVLRRTKINNLGLTGNERF